MMEQFRKEHPDKEVKFISSMHHEPAPTREIGSITVHEVLFVLGDWISKERTIEGNGWRERDQEEQYYRIWKGIENWKNYGSKGLKTPEQRFMDKWLDNIIKGNADARGEFIPGDGTY